MSHQPASSFSSLQSVQSHAGDQYGNDIPTSSRLRSSNIIEVKSNCHVMQGDEFYDGSSCSLQSQPQELHCDDERIDGIDTMSQCDRRMSDCVVLTRTTKKDEEQQRKTLLASDEVSFFELLTLLCFNFPYGFVCGTFGLWILPSEARRLFPDVKSITLGLSLVIVGASQLVCPVAGKVSDHHHAFTRFGKRRPFILWGCVIAILATLGMWFSSLALYGLSYYLFLATGMAALNVTYAVNCGVVPDLLNVDAQGRASGLVAVHTLLGSAAGFALVMCTADNSDFHFVYPTYIVSVGLSCWLTIRSATRLEARLQDIIEQTSTTSAHTVVGGTPGIFLTDPHRVGTDLKDHHRGGVLMQETDSTFDSSATTSGDPSSFRQYQIIGNTDCQVLSRAHTNSTDSVARVPSFDSYITSDHPPLRRQSLQKSMEMISTVPALAGNAPTSHGALQYQTSQHPHLYHDVHDLESTRHYPMANSIALTDIAACFTIDTSTSYDFFWVFCGRTMYYMGVSVQAFMLYFLHDVIGSSEKAAQFQLGCIALLAQFCAALIAYPVGKYSDESETGKKPFIYLSCACMSIVYLGFLISPLFKSYAFLFVLSTGALYGAGNGCFLAVDYALALATIPNKENTAQALGIWGVSAFIGSAVGPLLWGAAMEACGRDPISNQYNFSGYVAMISGGILSTCGAGAIMKLVRGVD